MIDILARQHSTTLAEQEVLMPKKIANPRREPSPITSSTQLGPNDVICARGRKALSHPGNQHFRNLLRERSEEYNSASTKLDKSIIVSRIISDIEQMEPSGRFVREDGGKWIKIGYSSAREKVGQGLREVLHTKYKSSVAAKKRKRHQRRQEVLESPAVLTTSSSSPSHVEKRLSSTSDDGAAASAAAAIQPPLAQDMVTRPEDVFMESVFNMANMQLLDKIKATASSKTTAPAAAASPESSKKRPGGHDDGTAAPLKRQRSASPDDEARTAALAQTLEEYVAAACNDLPSFSQPNNNNSA